MKKCWWLSILLTRYSQTNHFTMFHIINANLKHQHMALGLKVLMIPLLLIKSHPQTNSYLCTYVFYCCKPHTARGPAWANLAKHIKFPPGKFRRCGWVQTWAMPLFHLQTTAQHELFETWPMVLQSPWWGLCPHYREYVEFRAWWLTSDRLNSDGENVGGAVWAATSTHQSCKLN